MARTALTRGDGWRCARSRWSRPPRSISSTMTCRRRQPRRRSMSIRPVLAFDDVDFGFVPPPPVPVYFLPPPPPEFVELAAPLPAVEEFVLPVPIFIPIPAWCDPPAYVIPPANNVIFANIHNTIIVNRETNLVTIRNRHGEIVTSERRGFEPR